MAGPRGAGVDPAQSDLPSDLRPLANTSSADATKQPATVPLVRSSASITAVAFEAQAGYDLSALDWKRCDAGGSPEACLERAVRLLAENMPLRS